MVSTASKVFCLLRVRPAFVTMVLKGSDFRVPSSKDTGRGPGNLYVEQHRSLGNGEVAGLWEMSVSESPELQSWASPCESLIPYYSASPGRTLSKLSITPEAK